ncbi:MAG: hypothetical protein XFASWVDF_000059 [Candidatus Fervidibacter sp.]|jgi:hypothetical protein
MVYSIFGKFRPHLLDNQAKQELLLQIIPSAVSLNDLSVKTPQVIFASQISLLKDKYDKTFQEL